MIKRLSAWIVLIGFVLLIINITFLGYWRKESFVVYLILAVFFLIIMNRSKSRNNGNK